MEGYSLKKFFMSPFSPKVLPYLLLLFAALGFLDMAYLTVDHYRNLTPPCTIHGCDLVLRSQFSTIANVPVALIGALYFLGFIVLGGIFIQTKNKTVALLLFVQSILSLIVSAALVYIQAFVLHAFCQYCLFAELMFFLVFDTSWWIYNNFVKS